MAEFPPSERIPPSRPEIPRFLAESSPSEWIARCGRRSAGESAGRPAAGPPSDKPPSWAYPRSRREAPCPAHGAAPFSPAGRADGKGEIVHSVRISPETARFPDGRPSSVHSVRFPPGHRWRFGAGAACQAFRAAHFAAHQAQASEVSDCLWPRPAAARPCSALLCLRAVPLRECRAAGFKG